MKKLVAIELVDKKCHSLLICKNVDDKELATLENQLRESKDKKEQEKKELCDYLKEMHKNISNLEKEIDELKKEIKFLKGE